MSAANLDTRVLTLLGGLILLAQVPQMHRLPLWLAATGVLLVVARIALHRRGQPAPRSIWLLPLVIVGVVAIRLHYGYFFGRDPGVALLFLMAGLKFVETRTGRDGMLIVCLGAFLALTQFLYEQSLPAAAIMVVTVLYVGLALHALSGTWAAADGGPLGWSAIKPLLRLGGVMVLQSIPLAILLFLVFPRLTAPLWGLPTDLGAKTGLSDQMEPGSISELSLSDDIAFHVEFATAAPPQALRYWRGPVLSQFDGRAWRAQARPLPGRPAPVDGPRIRYTVTLEPHQQRWLFALDMPVGLPAAEAGGPPPSAYLTSEQQLLAIPPVAARMIYRQESVVAARHDAQGDEVAARHLRLPGEANSRARTFARTERDQAGSDAAYVRALLQKFNREEFGYTLSPPELGADAIDDFLFQTRRGFCEHYAGAFAFLLRAAGIPSRVVTGYQGGEINPASGTLVVRQSDAHAWVEGYLDGAWRRYDPTAAVAPQRVERGLASALPRGEPIPYLSRPEWSWLRAAQWRWDAVNHNWQKWVIGFNRERQQSMFDELGMPRPEPWQLVLLVAGVLAIWGLAYLAWTRWRERIAPADPLHRLWLKLGRQLARRGLPRAPNEGPLDYAARLEARWPHHAALWREMSAAYALGRYGPDAAAVRGLARLREAARTLRRLRLSSAAPTAA